MLIGSTRGVRNRLLATMSDDDLALLRPHFVTISIELRQVLVEPETEIERLFFPEQGIVSVTTSGSKAIEIGLIGPEGLVGALPVLLGSDRSLLRHLIQAEGEVLTIGCRALEHAVEQSASLRKHLLRYVHTLTLQMTQTALANALYDIDARLARWLLMCQDRIGDVMPLTHEFLSIMLGVQRTSVTLALQTLEGHHMIRARRGRIEVRDRGALLALAGEAYGLPEAEYARLIEAPEVAR